MKYLQKSFSSGANSQAYRDNFDQVFGNKEGAIPETVSEDATPVKPVQIPPLSDDSFDDITKVPGNRPSGEVAPKTG